ACSPDFSEYYGIPDKDCWAVKKLRQSGAELVAKTHMHELALGITGINPHYGTPQNPRAKDRIPGGSSSGSAVAVAAGMVPFSLGTDTGGSVRVPAGFCGIFGFRPTIGYIPVDGVVPLAFSLDTVGVFAKTAALLSTVSELLLVPPIAPPEISLGKAFWSPDALEISEPEIRDAADKLNSRIEKLGLTLQTKNTDLLVRASHSQRIIQGAEAWALHQKWLSAANPTLGADVRSLLSFGEKLSSAQVGAASADRSAISLAFEKMLGNDGIMILPITPGVPPKITDLADPEEAFSFRMKILFFTNLASLTGHPVVAVPIAPDGALPIGFQLIGPKGSDSALLRLAQRLESKDS
ncbi:MAG: amidase family protein, partial [Desulfarculaceae bacterium]